jgi:hypothetical protein
VVEEHFEQHAMASLRYDGKYVISTPPARRMNNGVSHQDGS